MLKSLSWLQLSPIDFREKARTLLQEIRGERGDDLGLRLYSLANHALDENQLVSLSRIAAEGFRSGVPLLPLTAMKLGVFGDGTLSLIAQAIAGTALRHRLLVDTHVGEFNSALMDALDPSSPAHTACSTWR